jgi:pectin methylesterase-like acyl-CoA thioesterase
MIADHTWNHVIVESDDNQMYVRSLWCEGYVKGSISNIFGSKLHVFTDSCYCNVQLPVASVAGVN